MDNKSADAVGIGAAEPSWSTGWIDGHVFCVVEYDGALCLRIGSAVESANVDERRRAGWSVGRKEFVEEGCSAVGQDGLGSEEEVGVGGFEALPAVELVLGQHCLIVIVAVDDICLEAHIIRESSQLGEVGVIECVVFAEEEIRARQRRVSFELLELSLVSWYGKSGTGSWLEKYFSSAKKRAMKCGALPENLQNILSPTSIDVRLILTFYRSNLVPSASCRGVFHPSP